MEAKWPIVLAVDDDEDLGLILEAGLASNGYRTIGASSLARAESVLRSEEVDALVCDLHLGDGTAIDLLRTVARRPTAAIVLTGFADREHVEATYAAGFDAHFVKPTSIEVIAYELDALLNHALIEGHLPSLRRV